MAGHSAAQAAGWPRLTGAHAGQPGACSGAERRLRSGASRPRDGLSHLFSTYRHGAAPANAVSSGQKGKDALVVRYRESNLAHALPTRLAHASPTRLACHAAVDLTRRPLGHPAASQVCQFFILMAEENLERLQRGEAQRFEWPRDFRGSLPTPTLQEPAD